MQLRIRDLREDRDLKQKQIADLLLRLADSNGTAEPQAAMNPAFDQGRFDALQGE